MRHDVVDNACGVRAFRALDLTKRALAQERFSSRAPTPAFVQSSVARISLLHLVIAPRFVALADMIFAIAGSAKVWATGRATGA